MRHGHPEAYRSPVVLRVQHVVCKSERLREVIHDLGVAIEGIREGFRIGPITVSEARVVRSDQVEVAGNPGKQRF